MNNDLTDKQRKVLDLIRRLIKKNKVPPTLKELGDALGMAPPSVLQHVRAIEKKGFLKRESLKSRSLSVIEPDGTEERRNCIDV